MREFGTPKYKHGVVSFGFFQISVGQQQRFRRRRIQQYNRRDGREKVQPRSAERLGKNAIETVQKRRDGVVGVR